MRDDGSTDSTIPLVGKLLAGRDNARFIEGDHLGAGRSYFRLLADVRPESRYAAFCDQDDIWLPGKLSAAVEALRDKSMPAMYCSSVELVFDNLDRGRIHRRCVRGPSFANALVENIATGCTTVLNRPAIDLLTAAEPRACVMHDAWCYLVIAACGQVIYDPAVQVRYRLHRSNAVGVGRNALNEWVQRTKRELAKGKTRPFRAQAEELRRLYSAKLSSSTAGTLDRFLGSSSDLPSRVSYALTGEAHFQRRLDDVAFRILYAAGRV